MGFINPAPALRVIVLGTILCPKPTYHPDFWLGDRLVLAVSVKKASKLVHLRQTRHQTQGDYNNPSRCKTTSMMAMTMSV